MGDKEVDSIKPLFERNVRSLKHSTYAHVKPTPTMTAFILTLELTERGQLPMLLIHSSVMRTRGWICPKQRFKMLPALGFGVASIYHFYY